MCHNYFDNVMTIYSEEGRRAEPISHNFFLNLAKSYRAKIDFAVSHKHFRLKLKVNQLVVLRL